MGGRGGPSRLALCAPPPQKIMHTRKRHQDMFQDLNRKLQHAEKDKEVLGPESKVWAGQRGSGVGPWAWGRAARALGRKTALSLLPQARFVHVFACPAWPWLAWPSSRCTPEELGPSGQGHLSGGDSQARGAK